MSCFSGWGKAKSIAYLTQRDSYPRGEVSEAVFGRLVSLVKHAPLHWFGYHNCDLDPCGSDQPPPELRYQGLVIPSRCSTDILVPDKTILYVAPSLILHYVRCHQYLPPTCFLDAALGCPEPGSKEYFAAVKLAAPR